MRKDKKFALVTANGVAANGMDTSELLSELLYAYLEVWNKEIADIDIHKAGMAIIELMDKMSDTIELDDIIDELLEDDEDEETQG